jgi:hypothetical protein
MAQRCDPSATCKNHLTDYELRIIIVVRNASTLPLCGVLRLLFVLCRQKFLSSFPVITSNLLSFRC